MSRDFGFSVETEMPERNRRSHPQAVENAVDTEETREGPIKVERTAETGSRQISANTFIVGTTPTQICGDDEMRSRVAFIVPTGGSVVIGEYTALLGGSGFTLPPGIVFEIFTSASVWAIAASVQTISVWMERD